MKALVLASALFICIFPAWSQVAETDPKMDGVVAKGEYAATQVKSDIAVGAKLSADGATLYVSVSAKTEGWISVGVGSAMMDGSFMILGFVSNGVPTISMEQGKGKSHSVVAASGVTAVVSEVAGYTTLEAAVPASRFVVSGKLDLIAAYGTRDNTTSRHSKRASYTLSL